jgi:DNA polymerase-1
MRLLVDISGLAYRAAYKVGGLSTKQGDKTNVVFGVLRSLEKIANVTDATEMVICWDRGSDKRKKLYPEYKANRRRDEEFHEDYKRQCGVLSDVLSCLPVVQLEEEGCEADDLIATISTFCWLEAVGIVTNDRDIYQLKRHGKTCILDHRGAEVDLEWKDWRWYLWYKVLVGDPSDNIKGVEGLGDKTARRLLEKHGTLKAIMEWARGGAGTARLGRMDYKQAKPIVDRNLKLMRVGNSILSAKQSHRTLMTYKAARQHVAINEEALKEKLAELNFASIISRLSGFLLPFRKMARANHVKSQANEARKEERATRRMRRTVETQHRQRGRGDLPGKGGAVQHPPSRRLRRVAGAVSNGIGSRQGWVRRVRRCVEEHFLSPEIRRTLKIRRVEALSLLSTFSADDAFKWLKRRTKDDLFRLRRLISQFELNTQHNPWAKERVWLKELHYQYTTELPEWMNERNGASRALLRKVWVAEEHDDF